MKKVLIESPFKGDRKRNLKYAFECFKDSFKRNEAPYASHLLYTQMLDDDIQEERDLGIKMGLEWGKCADKTVVYTDHGISSGMEYGIKEAKRVGRLIEYRSLHGRYG